MEQNQDNPASNQEAPAFVFVPVAALERAANALDYRISYIEGHLQDPHTRMPDLNRRLLAEGIERDKAAGADIRSAIKRASSSVITFSAGTKSEEEPKDG